MKALSEQLPELIPSVSSSNRARVTVRYLRLLPIPVTLPVSSSSWHAYKLGRPTVASSETQKPHLLLSVELLLRVFPRPSSCAHRRLGEQASETTSSYDISRIGGRSGFWGVLSTTARFYTRRDWLIPGGIPLHGKYNYFQKAVQGTALRTSSCTN